MFCGKEKEASDAGSIQRADVVRMSEAHCMEGCNQFWEKPVNFRLEVHKTMYMDIRERYVAEAVYKVLAGQIILNEGKLTIFGKRRVVPTRIPDFPKFSVQETLILPQLWEVFDRRAAWKSAREWIKDSVLWEKRTMPVESLGGYEKCLLMLLAAFTGKPDLVIIGDCMEEMEPSERNLFWKEVRRCRKRHPAAIIAFGRELNKWFRFDCTYVWKSEEEAVEESPDTGMVSERKECGPKMMEDGEEQK